MTRTQKIEVAGAFFGIVVGTLLHFTYNWSGQNPAVGLFSAVNESVWEHTKLVFFPAVMFLIAEFYLLHLKGKLFWAKIAEVVFAVMFIISVFYTYTGSFGVESLVFDIFTFAVAVTLGKYVSYRLLQTKIRARVYLPGAILVAIMAFYFSVTFNPPHVPLFRDSESGQYGVSE